MRWIDAETAFKHEAHADGNGANVPQVGGASSSVYKRGAVPGTRRVSGRFVREGGIGLKCEWAGWSCAGEQSIRVGLVVCAGPLSHWHHQECRRQHNINET